MAWEYFLYHTGYSNTLVERSNISFAPSPPYGEIYIDYFIPQTQSLYLFKESGGTIVYNDPETIDEYQEATAPPTPDDYITYSQFTEFSGSTLANINTRVYRSGDTMTGSLGTTANLTAAGLVSGSSICGGVWVHSPFICGSTKIQSPILTGSTCSIAPITIGTSCVCSPRILGSVSMCSPSISASTYLCSIGITRLQGATTAASTLNISGITKFQSDVCLLNPPTLTGNTSYTMFWNPVSKRIAVYLVSGGSTNYYYRENIALSTTTSTSPQKYLGYTGTTMPAGIYQVDFSEQVGQSNANSTVYGRFQVNGVTQGSDFLLKMNQAGFTFTNTLSRDLYLSGGTTAGQNCFNVYYWAAGGTACATFSSIRIRKI
jgi:hypothetical protein